MMVGKPNTSDTTPELEIHRCPEEFRRNIDTAWAVVWSPERGTIFKEPYRTNYFASLQAFLYRRSTPWILMGLLPTEQDADNMVTLLEAADRGIRGSNHVPFDNPEEVF